MARLFHPVKGNATVPPWRVTEHKAAVRRPAFGHGTAWVGKSHRCDFSGLVV